MKGSLDIKMSKSKLISHGAEAKIILNKNWITKDRISKSYRHPELDKQIRKRRTKAETKLLIKASQIIDSPIPFFIPERSYQIKMPYIQGKKLSEHLDKFPLKQQKQIMKLIGQSIAKLHQSDIIHGDLTTSNMIYVLSKRDCVFTKEDDEKNKKQLSKLSTSKKSDEQSEEQFSEFGRVAGKDSKNEKIFFIDFGLGFISKKIEDKAVDLHLLKQALEAKHFRNWKALVKEVFKSYKKEYSEAEKIFERITAIERRGRYRH